MLPADGKYPAISAEERRAGVARCNLSKLTVKLIEDEQELSAAVTIDKGTYKATIDPGATARFISEEPGGQPGCRREDYVDKTAS